ncbi:hypothetical protein [Janthinobacterium sp.]|uniref:hypothetical protein n=1 Tax=Janthinobacterium sp. TaxID=1871054 RepID=UPI00293D4B85|nr:hypothetical protein [Janthinobacterium sp.]
MSTATGFDVVRADPDRAALEIAHRALQSSIPLDEMLKTRCYELILKLLARRHMQRRTRVDVKKLQANDHD